ncbi:hypothetical protein [Catenulispora pinisilvae]|uniref:hypothetical protein n=1 Tax=Catenulispora pinisilvae TaxID=2705253 RepID=UPI00189239EE|nr:hypothetical protein [Catenulispora pinisilvae]
MSTPTMSRGARAMAAKRDERRALADAHLHLDDVEKWFIKRGLPHFIENYKATEDVFNRALPLFVVLVVVQMGLELTSKTVTWKDRLIGGAIGFAAIVVVILVANLIRQPQRWYRWPRKIGPAEITLLVLLGPVVGKLSGAGWGAVVADFVANILVLALVYLLVAYAILPVLKWALKHSFEELGNLGNLASKALPMLALFGTFLFLNVDMWHIASSFDKRSQLWYTTLFFAAITFLFLMVRLPGEVKNLQGEYYLEAVVAASADTPLHEHVGELDDVLPQLRTDRRQQVNMLFVLAFTQVIQILLLSVVVFVYFVSLGKLAVTDGQIADWLKSPECVGITSSKLSGLKPAAVAQACHFSTEEQGETWLKIIQPGRLFGFPARIPGTDIFFSEPLLRTAILLTTFSAFFFAVSAVTDEAYRKDFFESITGRLAKCLTIRCGYVNLYEKATRHALNETGVDPKAMDEDHRRTVQVPSMVADPNTRTPQLSSFQPSGGYPASLSGQKQIPEQSAHEPMPEDPLKRWPQQSS